VKFKSYTRKCLLAHGNLHDYLNQISNLLTSD
jgi:hypothetical protein